MSPVTDWFSRNSASDGVTSPPAPIHRQMWVVNSDIPDRKYLNTRYKNSAIFPDIISVMAYNDYDYGMQWDVDKVKLEFETGKKTLLSGIML